MLNTTASQKHLVQPSTFNDQAQDLCTDATVMVLVLMRVAGDTRDMSRTLSFMDIFLARNRGKAQALFEGQWNRIKTSHWPWRCIIWAKNKNKRKWNQLRGPMAGLWHYGMLTKPDFDWESCWESSEWGIFSKFCTKSEILRECRQFSGQFYKQGLSLIITIRAAMRDKSFIVRKTRERRKKFSPWENSASLSVP